MRIREFHAEQFLPRPLEEVFPFFASAENLEAITPPLLRFRIMTIRPIEMGVGTIITYRLRIRGIPVRWSSKITEWDPPRRFVDEQLRGPYRLWRHEHRFEPRDGGTLCHDHVRYATPFDWLTHRWLVRPDIERIFAFRRKTLSEIFGDSAVSAEDPVRGDASSS
jgi:ligand-binding SRPBCC domain-containing protein